MTNDEITVALTKGRLQKDAIKMFDAIGIDTTNLKDEGRKLILKDEINNINFVLAKAPDVITYTEHGVVDVGIVGKDTIYENGGSYYEVLDLKFGKCKFVVAGLDKNKLYNGYNRKKIASKYPNVTRNYFAKKNIDVEVIKIEGSVELAPIVGLSHAIVDIMETGSTLKANGLYVFDEICEISARLIVNIASMKMKKDKIFTLINNIQAYLEGRGDK